MSTMERGQDAQDQAPQGNAPQAGAAHTEAASKTSSDAKNKLEGQDQTGQEAPNYETTDGGQAIKLEDMSSANDEGAN